MATKFEDPKVVMWKMIRDQKIQLREMQQLIKEDEAYYKKRFGIAFDEGDVSDESPHFDEEYVSDWTLKEKIKYVINNHGELNKNEVIRHLHKLDKNITDSSITTLFYKMIAWEDLTRKEGNGGRASVNKNKVNEKLPS